VKIGIVCPYSFEVPGGVQAHIVDLAKELIRLGHDVSVLGPGSPENPPTWYVSAGEAIPIKFNGSVARLSFGPRIAARTKAWLEQGDFDIVHIHEPGTPSVGLLALMNADVPVVATFHASQDHSMVRRITSGLVEPYMERIAARIAVSGEARRTLVEHHAGDAVVIPNGVYCAPFAEAEPLDKWSGTSERPVIVFLGRLDEPRKGLDVFAGAIEPVLREFPGVRFLVAGNGRADVLADARRKYPDSVEVLGGISDEEKYSLFAGADIYVAPQLGGESFGIVLVEAMAAGTAVVASNIQAFVDVLDEGKRGWLFDVGDSGALANVLISRLRDREGTKKKAILGQSESWKYDWSFVTKQILAVYSAALSTRENVRTGTLWETMSRRLN